MATLADAQAMGFTTPDGNDLIRDGDDAISTNAIAAAELFGLHSFARARITSPANAFALSPGAHVVSSVAYADMVTNIPERWPGTFLIPGVVGQPVRFIIYAPYARQYLWITEAKDLSGGFMPWWKLGAARLGVSGGNAARQAAMMHHYGGPIDTGGLGAVSWRIDHGLTNFRDKLLPIFRAAGIVPMLTLNARDWSRPENTGVTQTEVNGWVANGWVEISNHGATHENATGTDAMTDWVVNGLAELETQIPAAAGKVWGFCIPGVGDGTGAFDGFGSGSTPAQWNTEFARLLLENHAFSTGYLPGTDLRVLDGTIRQGLLHMATDTRPVSEITAKIDQAIAQRKGFQIMTHPSLVDTAGANTTAMIQQIVDYIVAKRTAGQLAVLSPYQMMLADSTRPRIFNSGLRNITGLMTTPPTSGRVLLQRIGNTVWYALDELVLASVGVSFTNLPTLPVGYRPSASSVDWPTSPRLASDNDADKTAGIRIATGGNTYIYQAEAGRAYRCIGSYPTNDPVPTTTVGSNG